ncbi:ankyrin repeat domain-containing protein 16 [Hyalella azteca]|uniref:Ankyrin repeat domain-containing protein 16 n=1 Tax=Hyalella azteca TaxID=294128 RepID=A0A8B7P9Z2_HYAAZ|nr:ankyrin repeat domain-containing protein 16 [Hyalella azteca]
MRKIHPEYKALMDYIQRGLLGDVKKTVDNIKLMPRRVDWCSILHNNSRDTALHVVCRSKNDYMLSYVMTEGMHTCLEQSNVYGNRPLHEAAKISNIFAVNTFIEIGVKVDALNNALNTPLMLSVSSRDEDSAAVVDALLGEGSNSALVNQFGQTASHVCSGLGSLEALQLLLKHDSRTCSVTRLDGRSALHAAAHHGREDLLETLQERGHQQDSNVRALCGSTPIMDALRRGHVSTAAAITALWPLTHVAAKDAKGRGLCQVAAEGGYVDAIKFAVNDHKLSPLQTDDFGACSLHSAAGAGRCEAVQFLVQDLQVPVDVKDNAGKTPLWWALQNRHTVCAEQLLQLGAQPLAEPAALKQR